MFPTIEYNPEQWFFVPRKKVNKKEKWIYHVHCDGARFHVLRYLLVRDANGNTQAQTRCSEPDCIYNKPQIPELPR